MVRKPISATLAKPAKHGPRVNEAIEAVRVLLVMDTGEKRGIVDIDEALRLARAADLDLVEVANSGDIPVCKIVNFGKMRFEIQKKKAANKKRQKTQEVKEIKMRPNIDTHDYIVKIKAMTRFFERGDKVKVTIRFRGRERMHMERGMNLMNRVKEDFLEISRVEFEPKMEGNQMSMVMAPK